MKNINRRNLLICGGAASATLAIPAPISAFINTNPGAFVPPTTNIVHLAGRIARNCNFSNFEALKILGLDTPPDGDEVLAIDDDLYWYGDYYREHYHYHIEEARELAVGGDHTIYKRAQKLIVIKQKMNSHFNFSNSGQLEWLNQPNPHLQGRTFHNLMKEDIDLAVEKIDELLANHSVT